jgi:hypothetical protein
VPLAHDALTEDFVAGYEQNENRLSLSGAVRRVAYERKRDLPGHLIESVFDESAEVALWRHGGGVLVQALRQNLPGFEAPGTPHVCLLPGVAPFSEQDRHRIPLREPGTDEDRIPPAHGYPHLGLRQHPSGHDEALVERWARRRIIGGLTRIRSSTF